MTELCRESMVLPMMISVLLLGGCSRQVELMSAVPGAEANEIMAALQNAGIHADKVPGKEGLSALRIQSDDVARSVDLLREKGLPRERFAGIGQVFKKDGLISSPLEEKARYLYALSQELGATLSQIDGVVFARVHVVLPERGALGDAAVPSSAAVFIKHQDGYDLENLQPLVRRLVLNSIPGLTPEKISIVLLAAQPLRKSAVSAVSSTSSRIGFGAVAGLIILVLASLSALAFCIWKYGWPIRLRPGRTAIER